LFALSGFTFVLTNTQPNLRRKCTQKKRVGRDDYAGAVSKKTNFVVVGDETASKPDKAPMLRACDREPT
jgi:NAD-dependent DNA ligase